MGFIISSIRNFNGVKISIKAPKRKKNIRNKKIFERKILSYFFNSQKIAYEIIIEVKIWMKARNFSFRISGFKASGPQKIEAAKNRINKNTILNLWFKYFGIWMKQNIIPIIKAITKGMRRVSPENNLSLLCIPKRKSTNSPSLKSMLILLFINQKRYWK